MRIYYPIFNLSGGSIAGMPMCWKQRTFPLTRRVHGVPFFVCAPHMYTASSAAIVLDGRVFDCTGGCSWTLVGPACCGDGIAFTAGGSAAFAVGGRCSMDFEYCLDKSG